MYLYQTTIYYTHLSYTIMNDLDMAKNADIDNLNIFDNLNITNVIESDIYEKKFAEILISNEQEQFNFLKIYPLFKRKENILLIWKQHYDNTIDINKPLVLNFIILALKNDLIEYKTKDILNVIDGISDIANKELIRTSVINGKSKTGIKKISLVDDPHISPNDSNINIKELNFKEFAQELTRIFAHLNEKITYHELLFVAQHDNKYHKNENEIITPIELLIDHFHKLNYMVLHSILIEDKNDVIRIQTIKHILKICEELKILNNYHGLFALIAGLNNSSIQKIDNLWKNKKHNNTFIEYSEIINPSKNYKNYRDIIKKNAKNSIIPYIGITISDIKHVLECPIYDLENNNFNMNLYDILLTILNNYKNTPLKYNIEKNNTIFKWISNIKIIFSDSYFYDLVLNPKINNNIPLIPKLNVHEQLIHKLNNKPNITKTTNDELSNEEEFIIKPDIYEQTHDSVEDVIRLTNSALHNKSNSIRQFCNGSKDTDSINIKVNKSNGMRQFCSGSKDTDSLSISFSNKSHNIRQLCSIPYNYKNDTTSMQSSNDSNSMRQIGCESSMEEYNKHVINIPLNNASIFSDIPQYKKHKHKSLPPINKKIDNKENKENKEIKSWTINDVQKWLNTINMDMYCDVFLNEEIDGISLYNLTNEHLKYDMHIEKLGHRLKLLDALRTIKNS